MRENPLKPLWSVYCMFLSKWSSSFYMHNLCVARIFVGVGPFYLIERVGNLSLCLTVYCRKFIYGGCRVLDMQVFFFFYIVKFIQVFSHGWGLESGKLTLRI